MKKMYTTILVSFISVFICMPAAGQSAFTKGSESTSSLSRGYGEVYVLAVGVNKYQAMSPMDDLAFARNDASEIAAMFKNGFDYHVVQLLDEQATESGIQSAIAEIAMKMTDEDVFIFYFAGHGMTHTFIETDGRPRNTGMIIPYLAENLNEIRFEEVSLKIKAEHPFVAPIQEEGESDEHFGEAVKIRRQEWEWGLCDLEAMDRLPGYAIDMMSLRDQLLDQVPGKHKLMLFDSCFSGFAAVSYRAVMSEGQMNGFSQQFGRWNKLRTPSAFVITAGSSTQKVLEHNGESRAYEHIALNKKLQSPIKHGVFSYELLSVLRDMRTGDAISVNELWSEIDRRVLITVSKMSGGYEMHPQVRSLRNKGGSGQFVFVKDPIDRWLQRIKDGLESESMESDEISDVISRSIEGAVKSRQARLDQVKLESEALLVRVSRQSRSRSVGDSDDLQSDPEWTEEYRQTRRRASSGDNAAMATLAYMNAYGIGTKPNQEEAQSWAVEADGGGVAHASVVLSEMLSNGFLNEKNIEGINRLNVEKLNEQAMQNEAVGGVALMLAAQSSNNSTTRLGGTLLGIGMVADSFFSKAPPQSYQATLAQIDQRVNELYAFGEGIDDLTTKKQSNDFEKITASIKKLVNVLQNTGLNSWRSPDGKGGYIYPRRRMAMRAANRFKKNIDALREPTTTREVPAYQKQLEAIEMPYCEMVALADYLSGRRVWTHEE